MTVRGGTRNRLIRESIYQEIERVLAELGWTSHVTFLPEPQDNNVQIEPNTLALSVEDEMPSEGEMGSNFTISKSTYYLDFYGANQAIAMDLCGDLVAALRGTLPGAGREHPRIDVYDYRLATPTYLFSVEVLKAESDRTLNPTKPWLKHWHMVRFIIEDEF